MLERFFGAALTAISVITPTLNAGSYISDCLSAVVGCSTVREHIVVDGGSNDRTRDHVEEADAKFVTLAGSTIYEAMNWGAHVARGDVLLFANADDVLLSDGVDLALSELRASSCLWLVGSICMTNEALESVRMYRPPKRLGPLLTAACGYLPYPHPATLLHRSFFSRMGGFDERLRYAADYDFAIRALKVERPYISDATVAKFRMHGSNSSRSQAAAQEAKWVSRRYASRIFLPVTRPLALVAKRL